MFGNQVALLSPDADFLIGTGATEDGTVGEQQKARNDAFMGVNGTLLIAQQYGPAANGAVEATDPYFCAQC